MLKSAGEYIKKASTIHLYHSNFTCNKNLFHHFTDTINRTFFLVVIKMTNIFQSGHLVLWDDLSFYVSVTGGHQRSTTHILPTFNLTTTSLWNISENFLFKYNVMVEFILYSLQCNVLQLLFYLSKIDKRRTKLHFRDNRN